MPRFAHTDLVDFGARLLVAAGVQEDDARHLSEILGKADLKGYPGHGLSHLNSYVERINSGLIRLDGKPEIVRQGKTTALIDGDFYIGQIVAHRAMSLAVEKAAEHGVGLVAVRHSGHVGRLADYVELAAERGFIGIAAVSVGGGNIAPFGGMEPVAGTNPMAFGFPGKDGDDVIFDFATASLSMGELLQRVARRESIPDGVMLDGYGQPTTQYREFVGPPRGVVTAFGGHKGSGLHLSAEMLAGILSGNGLGMSWRDKGASAINAAYFQAIDVEEFVPLQQFRDQVEELGAFVRSRRAAPGNATPRMPGDGARERVRLQLDRGVDVSEPGWKHLVECAAVLNVDRLPQPLE